MKVATIDVRRQANVEPSAYGYFESPIGIVEIGGGNDAILSLRFVENPKTSGQANPVVKAGIEAISGYFLDGRRQLGLPLLLRGTAFQLVVWQQMLEIPYGQVASYRDIAVGIGKPAAARAVGTACGRNPVSLIVPCHRVIGNDGSLTGYGGGLWRKKWLLHHEGRA